MNRFENCSITGRRGRRADAGACDIHCGLGAPIPDCRDACGFQSRVLSQDTQGVTRELKVPVWLLHLTFNAGLCSHERTVAHTWHNESAAA
jgi:hypothetical protein